MSRAFLLLAGLAILLAPALAEAHSRHVHPVTARIAQAGETGTPCAGAAIRADRVITGSFGTEQQGSYVMVPFDVPASVTAVRVKYCYDQPENPVSASQVKHTLDLGLYEAAPAGALWGEKEFRGWGGSSHPDVTVSPQGFSTDQQYTAQPKGHIPGRTTRGYLPGPIPAGRWAVELGVAAVVPREQGDADGTVAWRVEVELATDPAFAASPYKPAAYDTTPARSGPGWYAGDLHVHADHSALGDATITETLDASFGPGKLDFITLSDYVTSSGWGEIGRHQGRYAGKLVARSAEVITYRGHTNNHGSLRYVDHRTGPVLEWAPPGPPALRRPSRAPTSIFDAVRGAGGWTQVNHPTIFPSEVPAFQNLCRGCPWDYSDAETDWKRVDAYEVHTGPPGNDGGANPFTLTAIEEYDRLRRMGLRIAAVGVSDTHNAARTPNPITQAPVGTGATVVGADELSERGIRDAVLAGRTYVKIFGPGSPSLSLTLSRGSERAEIGGRLAGTAASLVATVRGGDSARRSLQVLRDGRVIATVPVSSDDFKHTMDVSGEGDYRIQVMRGNAPDALTTPVRLGRPLPPVRRAPSPVEPGPVSGSTTASVRKKRVLRVRVSPSRVRSGRRVRLRFRVTAGGRSVSGALLRFGNRKVRTSTKGTASLRVRITGRAGRRTVRATLRGHRAGRATLRVTR
ncbi:MAG: hypothetical protein AVDCRST_MAG85-1413 [uncultured Solirubrobacteraceae bacterium]|uniref:Uncharacterized protein n=1 Tax=uncultured Solirubrobacteraceae bacterium TaxID=1162706 RepID=A0A6J4SLF3_9ACTN|nr:MAG: hypothetical protein AVDCRST_MAG85-1413 [uncultured Solirubrobacteraceae bacterium]